MATMNVSVTDKMKAWVEAKVSDGTYATASDCVRDLLRRQIENGEKLAALREAIRTGEESGVSKRSWLDLKMDIREHLQAPETHG